MKFLPESQGDLHRLVNWYNQDRITAEEYFAAVDEYARILFNDPEERVS